VVGLILLRVKSVNDIFHFSQINWVHNALYASE